MNSSKIGLVAVFSTLAFGVSAETLELAVGETRTLDSATSYEDGLVVRVAPETHTYAETYLTGANRLVLAGAKLDEYEFLSAGLRCKASSWGPGGTDLVTNVPPMFVSRSADSLVAQFQYYAGDVWPRVRGAKVELSETAEGLVARVVYVRYVNDWISAADGLAGVDFDSTTHECLIPNMATSDDGVAIGIKTLTLRKLKTDPGRLVITAPVDFGTGLEIGENAVVELQGEAACSAPSVLSGAGDLSVGPFSSRVEDVRKEYDGNVLSTWTVLATGLDCTLKDLTGIAEVKRRGSANPAEAFFFENDGEIATCQIQSKQGDYNRCAILEMKQYGDAIVAQLAACYYGWGAASVVGVDFRSFAEMETKPYGDIDPAWAASSSNPNDDGVGALTLLFDGKRVEALVRFDDITSYSGSVVLKPGSVLLADSVHSVPDLILDGGAVRGSGTVSARTLTLSSDSSLTLAEGAAVAFADSSALPWSAGAKLVVDGSFVDGASVRFGTSADALTRSQRSAISLFGMMPRISDEGWLLKQTGLILIFR